MSQRIFSAFCKRCHRYHERMAVKFNTKACECGDSSTVAACECGWVGSAKRPIGKRTVMRTNCPLCKAEIQRLTPGRLAVIREHTGRELFQHEALVNIIIKRRRIPPESYERCLDAGRMALIRAAIAFDPSQGVKFTTYATAKIEGYIQHALRDQRREEAQFLRYRSTVNVATARHNGEPMHVVGGYVESFEVDE